MSQNRGRVREECGPRERQKLKREVYKLKYNDKGISQHYEKSKDKSIEGL